MSFPDLLRFHWFGRMAFCTSLKIKLLKNLLSYNPGSAFGNPHRNNRNHRNYRNPIQINGLTSHSFESQIYSR